MDVSVVRAPTATACRVERARADAASIAACSDEASPVSPTLSPVPIADIGEGCAGSPGTWYAPDPDGNADTDDPAAAWASAALAAGTNIPSPTADTDSATTSRRTSTETPTRPPHPQHERYKHAAENHPRRH
jgi:hypothetical protein